MLRELVVVPIFFDTYPQVAVYVVYWNRKYCGENLLVFLHLHYVCVCVTQVKWKTEFLIPFSSKPSIKLFSL